MALSEEFPLNAEAAAELLKSLETKDPSLCNYPGCDNPKRDRSDRGGNDPAYCADHAHNGPTRAKRARKYLEDLIEGAGSNESVKKPAIISGEGLTQHLLEKEEQLLNALTEHHEYVRTLNDPAVIEARIRQVENRATSQIAQMQLVVDNALESSRIDKEERRKAETRINEERAAANEALALLDEADRKVGQYVEQIRDTKQRAEDAIAKAELEKEEAIVRIQEQANESIARAEREKEGAIATFQQQANKKIAEAEQAKMLAEDQAEASRIHVRDIETKAALRIDHAEQRVTHAEQRVTEIKADLVRERVEAQRTLERQQIEAKARLDREMEIAAQRLSEVSTMLTEAGAKQQELQSDKHQLREELVEARRLTKEANVRSDDLARLSDDLRKQLLAAQTPRQRKQLDK